MSETIAEFQFQGPNGFIQLQLEQESMDRYRICVLPPDGSEHWTGTLNTMSEAGRTFSYGVEEALQNRDVIRALGAS